MRYTGEEIVQKRKSPIDGYAPGAIMARFMMAAFFGVLFDLIVLFIGMRTNAFMQNNFWVLVVVIPLLWGVLGIFWLRQMMTIAKHCLEFFFVGDSRYR